MAELILGSLHVTINGGVSVCLPFDFSSDRLHTLHHLLHYIQEQLKKERSERPEMF